MPEFYIIDNISNLAVDLDGSPRAYAYDEQKTDGFLDHNIHAKRNNDTTKWSSNVVVFQKGKVYVQPDSLDVRSHRKFIKGVDAPIRVLQEGGMWITIEPNYLGTTIRQKNPYSGMAISKTSFRLKHGPDDNLDLDSYLNAEQYQYFVMGSDMASKYGMYKGDLAYVENKEKNLFTFAIVGDSGDHGNCKEGSLKLLRDLGYKNTIKPYTSGLDGRFRFIPFPKSRKLSQDGKFIGNNSGIKPIDIKTKGEIIFRRIIMSDKKNIDLFKSTVAFKLGFK